MMEGGAVVLFSGGMDSTWCLFWALEEFKRVAAVFVDYGQRNLEMEHLAAQRIAARAGVGLTVNRCRIDWESPLTSPSRELKPGIEDGLSRAFVPGRNLHLLTIGAAQAVRQGMGAVVIGCCENDAMGFPDCRPAFLRSVANTLGLALGVPIRVIPPLVRISKAEMLRQALKTPRVYDAITASWSCYTPAEGVPCGSCDACGHRSQAFDDVGT